MQRKITGFHTDDAGDWVAELDCGHGQHVRHKPPFFNRPWTLSEAGRTSQLGVSRDCKRCQQLEWPANLSAYKRTPIFSEETIPAGLRRDHSTRPGTWGMIHVLEGHLLYLAATTTPTRRELGVGRHGIIAPGLLHSVTPLGPVRFFVEFHRVSSDGS